MLGRGNDREILGKQPQAMVDERGLDAQETRRVAEGYLCRQPPVKKLQRDSSTMI
jgi:hypothetical protein